MTTRRTLASVVQMSQIWQHRRGDLGTRRWLVSGNSVDTEDAINSMFHATLDTHRIPRALDFFSGSEGQPLQR